MIAEPYSVALEEQLALTQRLDRHWDFYSGDLGNIVSDVPVEHVRTFMTIFRRAVDLADPYYWSPQQVSMLESVAPTMPAWTLTTDALVTRAGFCWFARPFRLPRPADAPEHDMRGFLWGDLRPHANHLFVAAVMLDSPDMKAVPGTAGLWPFGVTSEGFLEQTFRAEVPRRQDRAAHDAWYAPRAELQVKCIAAALAFLEQRILVGNPLPAARPTRKRVERAGWEHVPLVRVVTLRRPSTRAGAEHEASEPVEWSCQWVVRGHWRQQWCPKAQVHQPRWILPYVKGPPEKPLKPPRATVFAVVR
jgi:hypothetical protein